MLPEADPVALRSASPETWTWTWCERIAKVLVMVDDMVASLKEVQMFGEMVKGWKV